ncbi:MAG: gamma-glutamyltransferase family protein, partial [Christensenellaceae bacterium]|nr:gamma-glutamyltransferase family protein [Christensenellaceae bacterium]
DAIVAASDANNGFITHDDLIYAMNNYPKKEQPLHTNVFGYDIYTSNTPSSGGVILIEALNAIEYYCRKNNTTLQQIGYNSAEYLHVINTAMQLGFADKRKYVADNDVSPVTGTQFVNVPLEGLASKEYAQQRWDAIYKENDVFIATSGYDWGGASRSDNYSGRYADDLSPFTFQTTGGATSAEAVDVDDSGTTSFSVADSEGNIVSFTQTLNHFWGSYIMPENCGFMLNDQCTSFTIKTPAQSVHYVAPYKQPVSHIMPTIILKDGKPFATLGSPGSMRIPAAVLQVALNMMEFGMDIQSAINADRTYNYAVSTADSNSMSGGATYLTHKLMYLETSQLDAAIVNALKAKNYYIVEYKKTNLYFGGVQGIKFNYDNNGNFTSITGGADPRRDGKALAY